MDPYRLSLPVPPSIHEYYMNARRKSKTGKAYTGKMISPEGQAFRAEVFTEVRRGHRAPPKLAGALAIVVLVCKPPRNSDGSRAINRKGDLDNLWKCLLDSLTNAQVICDDVQFDEVRMIRGNPEEGGRLYLCIARFDPDAALAAARAAGLPCTHDYGPVRMDNLPF